MNYEDLEELEAQGKAYIAETAEEGSCQLWVVESTKKEYVTLCDNTVLDRDEDLNSEFPVFP